MQQKRYYIENFQGMNNVQREAAVRLLLNMDVSTDGKPYKREGFSLYLSLPGSHSLATDGTDLFCLATGSASLESLYRIADGAATEIAAVSGKGYPLSYVFTPERIYLSTKVWTGVYEYATGTVREWGRAYTDDMADFDGKLSEEWITFNVTPPPHMENLCMAGGRIWGSRGEKVFYNDPPLAYEMYRPDAFLSFGREITMIARAAMGMYFATESETFYAAGFDPENMQILRVGDGALPGSLQYFPSFRGQSDVPAWVGKTGAFVGMAGTVLPLTRDKLKFRAGGRVASLYRLRDGSPQYLFSSPADSTFSDSVTCEVVRKGQLI